MAYTIIYLTSSLLLAFRLFLVFGNTNNAAVFNFVRRRFVPVRINLEGKFLKVYLPNQRILIAVL